jgi:hypothetical protein
MPHQGHVAGPHPFWHATRVRAVRRSFSDPAAGQCGVEQHRRWRVETMSPLWVGAATQSTAPLQ